MLRGAVVLAMALLAGSARAEDPNATCSVRVIHALHDGEGIDPRITRLRPYLQKAPFTAWKRFVLLDEKELEIAPHASGELMLPNGKKTTLTYVEHFIAEDGDHRMRLQLTVSDGTKKLLHTTFVLDEGGLVVQAGQKHQNGLLILGVSCKLH